ncbi:hypothetical protein D3C84_423300 [compost metagenome]
MTVLYGHHTDPVGGGHGQAARAVVVGVGGGITQCIGLLEHSAEGVVLAGLSLVEWVLEGNHSTITGIGGGTAQTPAISLPDHPAEGIVGGGAAARQTANIFNTAYLLTTLVISGVVDDGDTRGNCTSDGRLITEGVITITGHVPLGVGRGRQQATIVIVIHTPIVADRVTDRLH